MKSEELKEIRRGYAAAYRKKHPERLKASREKYNQTHKAQITRKAYAKRADVAAKQLLAKKKWIAENPDMVAAAAARKRVREMNAKINGALRYHYEITRDNYDEILALQGSVCMICRKPQDGQRTKRLFVDHDHAKGVLRGLLCHFCNAGLGYFKENIPLFFRAICYLETFNETDSSTTNWESRVRIVLAALSAKDSEGSCQNDVGSADARGEKCGVVSYPKPC